MQMMAKNYLHSGELGQAWDDGPLYFIANQSTPYKDSIVLVEYIIKHTLHQCAYPATSSEKFTAWQD